ncbi:MAG TPA: PDZ domain-containing protein [Chloroflexota bacterium]|nr:PDZ domain-containing protein [Chloroflexota bacterium]
MSWLRRHWQWLTGPALIGLAALVCWFVPTGDFLVMPGHAVPARTMISVSSAPPKPGQGELLLLTIYSGPANVDEWVFGHFYPHARVVPARTQLPPNTSYERFRRLEESMMANSQATAKVVALRQLGYSVPERGQGAVVENVQRGSAAEAAGLHRGDLILALNGQQLDTAGQLVDLVAGKRPGGSVRLRLKPNDSEAERELEVTLRSRPNEPDRPLLGITPVTYRQSFDFPVQIAIDSKGIIGPSAGLVLTLAIMQAAGRDDLTHGRNVAATGTIDLDGRVGAVGGVADKVISAEGRAEYLLVPKEDYHAAKASASRVKVVEADTIQQAVDFLRSLA